MPLIRLETTERLAPEAKASLCKELSLLCATEIGKPEAYVMASIQDGVTICHAGTPGPAAFVEVRSIGGLSLKTNRAISEASCRLLSRVLRVPGERVYLNFVDVAASHWGHDGRTFG